MNGLQIFICSFKIFPLPKNKKPKNKTKQKTNSLVWHNIIKKEILKGSLCYANFQDKNLKINKTWIFGTDKNKDTTNISTDIYQT